MFVDDEESIRLTLPRLLEKEGFKITSVATVSDALEQINREQFDALLTDLNIHNEGDGFILVATMRRVQPKCRNFILTGYPGLENAIKALQSHVDDYFTKPADVQMVVSRIREGLATPIRPSAASVKRLALVLEEQNREISSRILQAIKTEPSLGVVPLSDAERVDHLPDIFDAIIEQLKRHSPSLKPQALTVAAKHGRRRKGEGYTIPLLVREYQIISETIYDVLQNEVMSFGTVGLASDLRTLTKSLDVMMLQSLQAYIQAK